MGDLSEVVKKGDRIKIYSADESIDKRIYVVQEKVRSTINLIEESSGKAHVVHKSRVAKIMVSDELEKEVKDAMEQKMDSQDKQPNPQPQPSPAPQPVAEATAPTPPDPDKGPDVSKAAPKAEKPKKEAKPKAEKKEAKPERVDFKALVAAGHEIWSKTVEFTDKAKKPIDGIRAESHCVFALDLKSFRVFNTYNGAMGKSSKKKANPEGVSYKVEDAKALDKKREALKNGGYKPRKK